MIEFLIKAAQLLLSLSILVVLHELGHFIPAKLFKTRVERFYLFFDIKFSLFKKKIGDTVYGIGWLPLGGYVKIAGMIDESMDKEQMAKPPQPWEFRSKPTWQRLIIMLGGVTVNFALAFVLYIMILFVWGTHYSKTDDIKYGFSVTKTLEKYGFKQGDKIIYVGNEPFEKVSSVNSHLLLRDVAHVTVKHFDGTINKLYLPEDIGKELFEAGDFPALTPRRPVSLDSVIPNSPAYRGGLLASDSILAIDGKRIKFLSDLTNAIQNKKSESVSVKVLREGAEKELEMTPWEDHTIGIRIISSDQDFIKLNHREYTLAESIKGGALLGYWTIKDYLAQFKYIFTKKGASQIGGFAAIGNMFPPVWDWKSFWAITAFLSIMLAVLNLLPIPALDGGHVMFLLYEMITGRKPNDKFMEYAQMVGFFILIALVLFANGNDIYKAIFN